MSKRGNSWWGFVKCEARGKTNRISLDTIRHDERWNVGEDEKEGSANAVGQKKEHREDAIYNEDRELNPIDGLPLILRELLGDLTKHERKVLELQLEGKTQQEVAEEMGLPIGRIASIRRKIRARLSRRLGFADCKSRVRELQRKARRVGLEWEELLADLPEEEQAVVRHVETLTGYLRLEQIASDLGLLETEFKERWDNAVAALCRAVEQ
jgi:DNA-binding CsgD family transcriptional regulator